MAIGLNNSYVSQKALADTLNFDLMYVLKLVNEFNWYDVTL